MMLEDYSNRDAAALCAYALARCEHEALDFESTREAFEEFGRVFFVKANSIKNFRDSFDPYTKSKRVGWHQKPNWQPKYLGKIYKDWNAKSDSDLLEAARTLKRFIWLPDLGEEWKLCQERLNIEPDLAEVTIPETITDRISEFLSKKRNYTVDHVTSTAMHITSEQKKQKSIISFALLGKIKHVVPFLKHITLYKINGDEVLEKLINALPPGSKKNEQSVFNCIRSNEFDQPTLDALLKNHFGNSFTANQFLKALKDETWSGITKSPFRNKKDVLNSVCCNKLNLENNKIGYTENLIEYLIDSGDELLEVQTVASQRPDTIPAIQPELDRNIIFFGAPGTGKSFAAKSYANATNIERIVFSADLQNADFIGYLQPQPDASHGVTYKFESGPFLRVLKAAFEKPDEPIVLLIEEINRGNAPAIFGELFQLLDRNKHGESEYKVTVAPSVLNELCDIAAIHAAQKIWLPSNLFIVGTMNSSDQGVFPLDTAFKRRFNFKYLPIDFARYNARDDFTDRKINLGSELTSWSVFAQAVNEALLEAQVGEDKLLGPFFLSPAELSKQNLDVLIVEKVCFYLWEDVLRHENKNTVFNENLRAFSDLQREFNAGKNIFSDTVLAHIDQFSLSDPDSEETGETNN